MRRAAIFVLLALAACGEPEPAPGTVGWAERREKERKDAERQVRETREAREVERLRLGAQPAVNPARLKEELLEEYGPRLTRFQRSALLAATIATREEGENMCRKWIAENEAFEHGQNQRSEDDVKGKE